MHNVVSVYTTNYTTSVVSVKANYSTTVYS